MLLKWNKNDFHDEGLVPEQTPYLTYLLLLIDSAYKVVKDIISSTFSIASICC